MKKYKLLLITVLFIYTKSAYNQNIGINSGGTVPDPSAMLDVFSTSKGVLVPNVALTATNAAGPVTSPAHSLLVYNTATAGTAPNNVLPGYYYWDNTGSVWVAMGGQGGLDWSLTGNSGTTAGTNFIGTLDATDFQIKVGTTPTLMATFQNSDKGVKFENHISLGGTTTDATKFIALEHTTVSGTSHTGAEFKLIGTINTADVYGVVNDIDATALFADELVGTHNIVDFNGTIGNDIYGTKNELSVTTGDMTNAYGNFSRITIANNGISKARGNYTEVGSVGGTSTTYAAIREGKFTQTNTRDIATVYGTFDVLTDNLGASNVTDFYANRLYFNKSGTGTYTNASFLNAEIINDAGTITNLYGINFSQWVNGGGGTVTNSYGIYMDNSIGLGATSYAIYSATSADSYLEGSLGIGVSSPLQKLHVFSSTDAVSVWGQNTTAAGTGVFGSTTSATGFGLQGDGASGVGVFADATTGTAAKFTLTGAGVSVLSCFDGATEVFTVDYGGDVGVGVATPLSKLHIKADASNNAIRLEENGGTEFFEIEIDGSGDVSFKNDIGSTIIKIEELTAEVGIGTTTPNRKLEVRNTGTGVPVMRIDNYSSSTDADGLEIWVGPDSNPTSTNDFIQFKDGNGTQIGAVEGTGAGGVFYNTTSDRRLKQNIVDVENALSLVDKMKPREYEFKSAPELKRFGFIAQELQMVYPQAVSGDPNGDVEIEPMGVDYGKLTPILTAAIKELIEENKLLKSQMNLMKSQLEYLIRLETDASDLNKK